MYMNLCESLDFVNVGTVKLCQTFYSNEFRVDYVVSG